MIECFFHFCQAIWRQVQNKGWATKYREDQYFRLNIKKLIALAFIPPSDVATAFDLVAGEFDDDADDFLDYFEKIWIGKPRKRGNFFFHYHLISCILLCLAAGRKKAQFEHQLWNIYDCAITGILLSNNSVEGWHNAFTSRVSVNHPNNCN